MQQEPLNLTEFQRKFATEEACLEHLFTLRWPEGYGCRRCGHDSYYFHSTRKLYQCKKCKYQVSVTAGTIFDNTRIPFTKWFVAIFIMTIVQKDVPIRSLGPRLGIRCYKTLWLMAHKIRKALATGQKKSNYKGLSEFNNALLLCLSSDPATFADLKS